MLLLILRCLKFLESTITAAWRLLTHLGYFATLIISKVCSILLAIFNGIIILGEEFRLFICSIGEFIDNSIKFYYSAGDHFATFLFNSLKDTLWHRNCQIFSKESLEIVSKNVTNLLLRSIYLIGDVTWWLVTFLPKAIYKSFFYIVDICGLIIAQTIRCFFICLCYIAASFQCYVALLVILYLSYKYSIFTVLTDFIIWHTRIIIRKVRYILHNSLLWLLALFGPSFPQRAIRSSTQRCLTPTDDSQLSDHQRCVVCKSRGKSVLLWPCRHLCLCEDCADTLDEENMFFCPLCRASVEVIVSVYL